MNVKEQRVKRTIEVYSDINRKIVICRVTRKTFWELIGTAEEIQAYIKLQPEKFIPVLFLSYEKSDVLCNVVVEQNPTDVFQYGFVQHIFQEISDFPKVLMNLPWPMEEKEVLIKFFKTSKGIATYGEPLKPTSEPIRF